MDKQQAYRELVQKRKAAEFPAGLQNPSQIASGTIRLRAARPLVALAGKSGCRIYW
jgi:hypothetical protein